METLSEAMARVKAHTDLKEFCEDKLAPAKRGNQYVCPFCGSGGHDTPTSDSDFHLWGDGFKCFSCQTGGDIFDLAGKVYETEDRAEQCNLVAAWAGVEGWQGATESQNKAVKTKLTTRNPKRDEKPRKTDESAYSAGRARHAAYIAEAQARIGEPEAVSYLSSRGIDLETARSWGLGYDPHHAKGWQDEGGAWHNGGRIVIPWRGSAYYHIDRAMADDADHVKYSKPSKDEVGPQPMWNPAALKAPAFFVVEGALDALAIQACGYEAVAMGSTRDNNLTEALGGSGVGVAILVLDNDDAGKGSLLRIVAALGRAGVTDHYEPDTERLGTKDTMELFAKDRDMLASILKAWHDEALATREQRLETEYVDVLKRLRVLNPIDVITSINLLMNAQEPIPCGIRSIDKALGGGLPSRGLVTLGAVSSVGKTTLALQWADHMAEAGRTVLFVTVEQSAEELVSKSLSRIMATISRSNGRRIRASSQAIMSRAERDTWDAGDWEKHEALDEACIRYAGIVDDGNGKRYMHIMEATKQPTVSDIWTAAERITDHDGKAPIIFIDYLQLLAPEAGHERDSDKQVVDKNMLALRQMARELNTCVVVISSLNRAAYNGTVSLESFKESGSVEYSSDVLLGLQPEKMEEETEDKAEAKARRTARLIMRDFKATEVRRCELCVLKNRNGGLPRRGVPLEYDALANTFKEG